DHRRPVVGSSHHQFGAEPAIRGQRTPRPLLPRAVSEGIERVGYDVGTPVITGQLDLSVDEEATLTVALTDLTVTDTDSTYPGDFTLTLSAGDNYTVSGATITPTFDFNGTLSVPVTVNDGTADSAAFNLTVTVNPVNDAPVITASQTLSTNEDQVLTLSIDNIRITDPDNTVDQLTMTIMDGDNYSVSGMSVTPVADFNGTLSVMVKVNDGQLDSNTFGIEVTVSPINDAPLITGPATMSIVEGTSLTLTAALLEITDVDNAVGDMTLTVSAGENYTLDGSTITPTANFTGTLSVMIKVNDGSLDSNTFTVSVTVTSNEVTLISQLSFTDANLATCITDTAAANGWSLIDEVVSLNCSSKNVSDISGIEQFAAKLASLDVSQNIIVDIASLSGMSALKTIKLQNNKVSQVTALFDLTQVEQVNLLGNDHIACTNLDALISALTQAQITRPKHCDGSGLAITEVPFKSDNLR
ncbi:MAG: Ig-like domain-containing protein, partial [Psychrosphaera sp.]|nr:Ig-like domain-containing protein [Psychrosphaera sp.]